MKTKLILIALLIFAQISIYSQTTSWSHACGTKPLERDQYDEKHREVAEVPDTIIIPVVFHILTQGGVENISKEQVLDGLRKLNEDYSNRNTDTLDIPVPFSNVRGNPKIEFRLARIDPKGNCTDGIERIYTPYTYGSHQQFLGGIYGWDNKRYMNIYVLSWIEVPNDFTLAGVSYLLPNSPTSSQSPNIDGLGIIYNEFMNGESGYPNTNFKILTHEIGHLFGLLHIFGTTDDCNDDDLVNDTPKQADGNFYCPTFPQISCNNGPNGDMFMNYMDYTDCRKMFTQGQVDRMRSCLAIHPWRKDQWTEANHIQTGVKETLLPCENKPVADFGYGNWANWNGAGYSVRFNEACSWDPDSFYWEFEGGNPANSTGKFPRVIFQDTGFHKVTLIVSGSLGSDTIARNIYISPGEIMYDGAMTETFENDEEAGNLVLFNLRGTDWKLTDTAAKTGTRSFFNPGNSQYISGFFTHNFELGSTPMPGRHLTFDVALGMSSSGSAAGGLRIIWKRPDNFDRSDIFGQNEGTSLVQGEVIPPETLKTTTTNSSFIPNASQWKTITLPIPDTLTGQIQIGFLWANFIQTTKFKGLYIDNIRISNTTSVTDTEFKDPIVLYPNPACDHFTIDISQCPDLMNAVITVYDLYGRVVLQKKGMDTAESHDISHLGNGIYFIELRRNDKIFRNKLLITR